MSARPSFWAAFAVAFWCFAVMFGTATQFSMVALTIGLGLVQLTDEQKRQGGARIREALRRADISVTKAALIMGMDASDLEKALNCAPGRRLDLWRLEMLPPAFWQEYWPLLARDKGLPEQARTFVKALPVLLGLDRHERSA